MQTRPCWAEIDTLALEANLHLLGLEARRGCMPEQAPELLAVLKGDAYGHSLALCAPAAARAGASWLGVTSVEEAVAARTVTGGLKPEIKPEILVLSGPFAGEGAAVVEYGLTCSVWNAAQLDELQSAAHGETPESVPVHLEIDTGMSRQGVSGDAIEALLAHFRGCPALRLDGVMTHLYAADEADRLATRQQIARLEAALPRVRRAGFAPRWLNVGNSAALLDEATRSSLVALACKSGMRLLLRPGLALYGLAPEFAPKFASAQSAAITPIAAGLKPVLRWKTRITSLCSIPAGETVGYSGSFRAKRATRLALLPAGYADGLKRQLSDRGHVLIAGHRAPFAGRISMDQSVVDVTKIPEELLHAGDEVVLLGAQGKLSVSAEDHARWAGTIPWEIFTSIGQRVERRTA